MRNDVFIYPCNPYYFDIKEFFASHNKIVWRAISNIKSGDIVYIYVGKTIHEICYKCKVSLDNVTKQILNDNIYAIPKGKISKNSTYVMMEKICEYQRGTFPLDELKAHGMGQFMVPMKASDTLKSYLIEKERMLGGDSDA